MHGPTLLRSIGQTAASVLGLTALCALGPAGFALLCESIHWALGGSHSPVFDPRWLAVAGAATGLLVGLGRALDHAFNRREALTPSRRADERAHPTAPVDQAVRALLRRRGSLPQERR